MSALKHQHMKANYIDLIKQTFDFPQGSFTVQNNELYFDDIRITDVIKQYGTPLKITYLPKISSQIQKAHSIFKTAMAKAEYKGNYTYCYCTKSSHFSFVIEEVLKTGAGIETSSAYDIEIIKALNSKGKLAKDLNIVCNGFKMERYMANIADLVNDGYSNVIPVLDNMEELDYYKANLDKKCKLGIRIASEEEPNFEFYTSRLGIRYTDIKNFYTREIQNDDRFELKMLHFFINTGIRDSAYYWTELNKCLNVYKELKDVCPSLNSLNIGGGLPIQNSLGTELDYNYIINEIIYQIKAFCVEHNLEEPNIFTEFGTFTVGESGINLYSVLDFKQQNDRELWYMIDSSFITTLPDAWGINQRFILLAINHWDNPYRRVNIGGLTCDSLDYYNSEAHDNQVFLPEIAEDDTDPLYIGFFHTGAYQESLSGYGGTKHCLIPSPKHVIIDKDSEGNISSHLFAEEQSHETMLSVLGY